MKTHIAATIAIIFLLVGCGEQQPNFGSSTVVDAMSVVDIDGFKQATEPMEFSFPLDHGPHPEYATEWWYYTGNLVSEEGEHFGYQLTFFRSALTPHMETRESTFASNQIYMAHFAITDVRGNNHVGFERFSRGGERTAGATGVPSYEVWLDGWQVKQVSDDTYQMQAEETKDGVSYGANFTLSGGQQLFHGNNGLSQKGAEIGDANHYYSVVKIETEGTITIGGENHYVSGLSWLDHEFGTDALDDNTFGWDWFSLTLDNDTTLMFAQLRNALGERIYTLGGTMAYVDGRNEKLNQLELIVLDEWTSPDTQVTYPARWQVILPEQNIELLIEPMIPDQEMKVSLIYYEGAISITGDQNGTPLTGSGYVELTGYTNGTQS